MQVTKTTQNNKYQQSSNLHHLWKKKNAVTSHASSDSSAESPRQNGGAVHPCVPVKNGIFMLKEESHVVTGRPYTRLVAFVEEARYVSLIREEDEGEVGIQRCCHPILPDG